MIDATRTGGVPMDLKFLVISDTHFCPLPDAPQTVWWNQMLKRDWEEIAEVLVDTVCEISPDFALHCGDVTADGRIDSFLTASRIIERFRCPCYITPGNHDTFVPGARAAMADCFACAGSGLDYVHRVDGLRFIFLDSAWWIRRDGSEDESLDRDAYRAGEYFGIGPKLESIEWVDDVLSSEKIPTILVTHPPFSSKAEYRIGTLPCRKPVKSEISTHADFAEYAARNGKLLEVIDSAQCVKAVFSGHWHITEAEARNGTWFCQTGSMIEFPFEMRYISVRDGSMAVSTVGLRDGRLRQRSFLPELKNEWVAGSAADREFEIRL